MDSRRFLVIMADDYGIGPATSQGILDLAERGLLTATVLLVNSPHAEQAVRLLRRGRAPLEVGWHPCLTLDRPVLAPKQVPSLVDAEGRFRPLGRFLRRLVLGLVNLAEIEAEWRAQHRRFRDLTGHYPLLVNAHHHLHVFPRVGRILRDILRSQQPLPYLRRVQESWRTLIQVPGARSKRAFLTGLGRRQGRCQEEEGFPGNDALAGITDPLCDPNSQSLVRWLRGSRGRVVELACHPGYLDFTLVGRDSTGNDGLLERRLLELGMLKDPRFRQACDACDLTLVAPGQLTSLFRLGIGDGGLRIVPKNPQADIRNPHWRNPQSVIRYPQSESGGAA